MTCVRVVLLAYAVLSRGHVTLRGPLLLSGCERVETRSRYYRNVAAVTEGRSVVWTSDSE